MPTQDVPNIPEQSPGQSTISLPTITNPYLGIWWATQTVSNVPENIMGWLVAQGYEITGISQDTSTTPPTNYFSLTREGMQPWQVLLSLCNSYTVAANDAREANQLRYNEIVTNWTQLIATSHDQFDAQTEEQNAQAGVFLADLEEYMNAIDTLIAENQSQLVIDAAEAKSALIEMDMRLGDLEQNASDNALTIGTLLAQQTSNLQVYIDSYATQLNQLQQNVVDHIDTVLAQLSSLDQTLGDHVDDYLQQLDSLTTNYNFHLSDIDGLLSSIANNVNTFVADAGTILAALDTDYQTISTDLGSIRTSAGSLIDAHVADYQSVLALLSSDYSSQASSIRSIVNFLIPDFTDYEDVSRSVTDSLVSDFNQHADYTRTLLTGLGSTELARINEESQAKLSSQLQSLVSAGLSTSTLVVDVTQRNHRDRDEQIQRLNDQLNREKVENDHRLYEQQRGVRGVVLDSESRLYDQKRGIRSQTIEVEMRLYEQQLNMRTRTLEGKNQLHSVRQEVLRYQATLISGTFSLLQEARNRVLAGKQAILSAKDSKDRLGIEVQNQLYQQAQDVRQRKIEASDRIYQLRDIYAKWANTETHRTYEQLQQIRQQFVESVERQHSAKQTATRTEITERDALLQQLQTALSGLLSGKERFSAILMQNANTLAEHRHRVIAERMNTAAQRLEGWRSVAADNRALMAYQLDERNKLLVGLYSFVERRDDVSPDWKDMASMIAGLGDSAGGWIQP